MRKGLLNQLCSHLNVLDPPVIIIAPSVVGVLLLITIIVAIAIVVVIVAMKTSRKRKQVTLTQGTCTNTLILYTINYVLLCREDTC